MEGKKASLALEIQNLEKDVKEWEGKMLDIQVKTAEYQRLKGNSQRIQALYDRLLATMQTLDVNKEISPESVTIMEPASQRRRDQSDLSQAAGRRAWSDWGWACCCCCSWTGWMIAWFPLPN